MQESNKITTNLGEMTLLEMMRQAVREEIRTLSRDLREKERLLKAQDGAEMLSVSPDWLSQREETSLHSSAGTQDTAILPAWDREWIGTRSIS